MKLPGKCRYICIITRIGKDDDTTLTGALWPPRNITGYIVAANYQGILKKYMSQCYLHFRSDPCVLQTSKPNKKLVFSQLM